jgi:tRNA pseudouridine-54 N-methylase
MSKAQSRVSKTQKSFQKDMGKTNKVSQSFQKRMSNAATATAALQGPLGPIAGRMRSFGALMGSAGFAAGALILAITALVAAFRSLVTAASRAEQAQAKFSALVQATGGAAGLTVDQLELMSRQFAQNTLFSVQQMRDAQGVLLTFKSVAGEAFERTIAVATDVASVMGTDVKSATLQLGKALEEPRIGLSMLRRSGISFTESQKQLIFSLSDTNQKAAAMSEVLTIIENQLGGVAARAAGEGGVTTVAGAFDELGRKFTLFQEELLGGTTLLRMFTSMVLKLADAIPVVDFSGMTDIDLKAFINNSNVELEQMNLHLALLKELAESDATGMFSGQLEKQMENIQKLTKKIQEAKDLLAERGEMKNVTVNTVPSGEGDFTLSKIFIDAKKKTDAFSLSQQSLAKQLGVTGADLELLKMKQAILNKAKLDGVVLTEKQIQMLDDLVEETREHAEALEQMQKVYGAFENAVNKAFSTVENSILGLIQGTETLKGVMKKMMQAFIADLTTSILKMLILDRLKKQVLGMIGASAGGGFGAVLGSIFGRQGGGSVSNNTPYMVGEKGPELFIPNSSGRVAPLDKAGFGAQTRGTTPIVVEQHINFTTGVQATVRSEVLNLLPQIQNSTIAAVQEARLRGGKFAESFGAR